MCLRKVGKFVGVDPGLMRLLMMKEDYDDIEPAVASSRIMERLVRWHTHFMIGMRSVCRVLVLCSCVKECV